MGKLSLWALGLTMCLGVSACLEPLQESDFYLREGGVYLDPALPGKAHEALRESYTFAESLNLNGSDVQHFSSIFGGEGAPDLLRYVRQRVHYLISADVPVAVQTPGSYVIFPESGPGIVARNVGAAFLSVVADFPDFNPSFYIGATEVPSETLGRGYVQLSELFYRFIPGQRFVNLIHEARHSDCYEVEGELICGHHHVACPTGHPLEGLFTCDEGNVGAHYLTAKVSKVITEQCEDCGFHTKELLRQEALWSLQNILNLEDIQNSASHLSFRAEPFRGEPLETTEEGLRRLLVGRLYEVYGVNAP